MPEFIEPQEEEDSPIYECSNCGVDIPSGYEYWHEGYIYCESCDVSYNREQDEEDEEYYDSPLTVYDYFFKPLPEFQLAAGEKMVIGQPLPVCLGIELEFEYVGASQDDVYSAIKGLNWLYLKRDGSLSNGLEIVTHPMSFAWLCEHRKDFSRMLNTLRRAGARSHSTRTCGLHVHMSRHGISNGQLLNMLKVLYENPEKMLKLSRRTRKQIDSWARLWVEESDVGAAIKKKIHGLGIVRYEALNLTPNATVEFRLFRGTLMPNTFFGCLEFCMALYLYAKDVPADTATWDGFTQYILTLGPEYLNLARMITERLGETAATTSTEEAS